ncbi:MAG: host attachment protein [Myxococcales bacterium]|nr:MAG: host attachment protein [Myxococcales bacterium]
MMKRTWIVIAHRAGARIVQSNGPASEIQTIQDVDHPEGKLKAGEVNADRPGQSVSSHSTGPHPMVPTKRVTEEIADEFAREIAGIVERARLRSAFDQLALVAAPRFLGRLRNALPAASQNLVIASLSKNVPDLSPETIREQLAEIRLV